MGLYDTVYVCQEVLDKYNVKCLKCAGSFDAHREFQTKDFECGLDSYYLRLIEGSHGYVTKLYKLDPPENPRFWYTYTDQEVEEFNKAHENDDRKFWAVLKRQKLGGYWLPEAYWPENRRQRDMGELPHQWVEIYTSCPSCQTLVELSIKFTDGKVESFEQREMENYESK
jgi:hypothetical protein